MEEVPGEAQEQLTIVSRRLLRVSADEWRAPSQQFQRLQGGALEALLATSEGSATENARFQRVLLLFDCMLRVIAEPPLASPIAFATARFRTLQLLFYGALGSEVFINVSAATRICWAHTFYTLVQRLSKKTPVSCLGHRQTACAAVPTEYVSSFDTLQFDSKQVRRLRPYLLRSKSGVDYNVLLGEMVPILGERFTTAFYEGLCSIARPKAKDAALRDFGTTFVRFVCHRASAQLEITPELLAEPSSVQTLLVDFMEYHFMKMTRRQSPVQEGTLSSLQKLWSRYRIYWASLASLGVLAAPETSFPAGNSRLLCRDGAVAHRRFVPAEDGTTTLVTQKLIVVVPLQVTDEEATQLLFEQLQSDFKTLQEWLRAHLVSLFEDYVKGRVLADAQDSLPPDAELQQLVSKRPVGEAGIALAVKYFIGEQEGYVDTSKFPTPIYPRLSARGGPPKKLVSRYLGLPGPRDAMALMAFLASHDGRFSEAAVAAATLLDGNGKRVNAVETDAGLTITVLKERDAGDGWHDVVLNGEPAEFVRRWIEVTNPIRGHMRRHGIKGWRNLFVYVGQPLGAPGHFNRATNIHSAFQRFAVDCGERLGPLATRITIPRIRSTRGVLVFLETMDLSRMARELGNSNVTSLRHYLPDSLWEYFATRWLRIFQNLLIVEATKGTPYMQRALHFRSAAEMDEFLKSHALTPLLPEDDPGLPQSFEPGQKLSEVLVAASPILFETLLSISAAAGNAIEQGRRLTPQALYWSEFTKRLRAYVESDAFHDRGIKRMLSAASASLNPSSFAEVVCA